MNQSELASPWQQTDPTQYASMSFLSRYRGGTLRAYSQDLRYFLRWCSERCVEPLLAERPHLELYLRWMEQQGTIADLHVPPPETSPEAGMSNGAVYRAVLSAISPTGLPVELANRAPARPGYRSRNCRTAWRAAGQSGPEGAQWMAMPIAEPLERALADAPLDDV